MSLWEVLPFERQTAGRGQLVGAVFSTLPVQTQSYWKNKTRILALHFTDGIQTLKVIQRGRSPSWRSSGSMTSRGVREVRCRGRAAPQHTEEESAAKVSIGGELLCASLVRAGCAGPVQPADGPAADPGASEGDRAGPGLHLTVRPVAVVDAYPEEAVGWPDGPVGAPVAEEVLGCRPLRGPLALHFLPLERMRSFRFSRVEPARIVQLFFLFIFFKCNKWTNTHRQPQEVLRSAISAVPCVQRPINSRSAWKVLC